VGGPTDEMLMAYADGELEPVEQARIMAILESDHEARERLELFIATGAPIAEAYSRPMNEPVPPHLIALVMNYAGSEQTRIPRRHSSVSVASILRATGNALFGGLRWQTAAAWSVLVMFGGAAVTGFLHHQSKEPELVSLKQGQIIAQGPLKQALDSMPSGTELAVQTGTQSCCTMRAVLSFKNRQQAFCRQYSLMTGKGAFAGVACRSDDGQWRLEVHMAVNAKTAPVDRARPAGGQAAAIEAAVSNAIDGDALGPEEEKILIGQKWAQ
jgi:surface antigen